MKETFVPLRLAFRIFPKRQHDEVVDDDTAEGPPAVLKDRPLPDCDLFIFDEWGSLVTGSSCGFWVPTIKYENNYWLSSFKLILLEI